MNVSVIESGATDLDDVVATRPDIGLILDAEGSVDAAIAVAAQLAATSGGGLCLMWYIDDEGRHDAHEFALESAAARVRLTELRARCHARDPHLRVTDRLHIGTLESLLETLEPSIGSIVIGPAAGSTPSELLAVCPLPMTFVGPDGTTYDADD